MLASRYQQCEVALTQSIVQDAPRSDAKSEKASGSPMQGLIVDYEGYSVDGVYQGWGSAVFRTGHKYQGQFQVQPSSVSIGYVYVLKSDDRGLHVKSSRMA